MFIVIFWTFVASTVPGLGQPLLQLFTLSQPNYFFEIRMIFSAVDNKVRTVNLKWVTKTG